MIRHYTRWLLPRLFWVAFVYTVIWFLSGVFVGRASAQEPEVGTFGYQHMQNHEQYKEWHSASGMSCCNGQDCRPIRARPEGDDKWSIWIPELRQWVPVPASAELKPDILKDGRSHACTADPNAWKEYGQDPKKLPVYCFSHAEAKY